MSRLFAIFFTLIMSIGSAHAEWIFLQGASEHSRYQYMSVRLPEPEADGYFSCNAQPTASSPTILVHPGVTEAVWNPIPDDATIASRCGGEFSYYVSVSVGDTPNTSLRDAVSFQVKVEGKNVWYQWDFGSGVGNNYVSVYCNRPGQSCSVPNDFADSVKDFSIFSPVIAVK